MSTSVVITKFTHYFTLLFPFTMLKFSIVALVMRSNFALSKEKIRAKF